MKFISVRELRNHPGQVWEDLKQDDLVLTANGKPVGILLGVAEEDLEEALTALRRARAQLAVSKMRRRAAETGLAEMTLEEIEEEIQAVRRGRRSS